MLELGKTGSAGVGKGVVPVLSAGTVVATLRASRWKEAAIAVVGGREWVFGKARRELTGRWAEEPEGAVRVRARRTSAWRGTWALDLEGTPVEVRPASRWKGTHRYLVGGRQIAESGVNGFWGERPTLTAGDTLPLAHQIFLLWFEWVLQRRATTTAAAAAGAAAAGAGGAAGGS